ncbi:MAG: biosynthetic arginine decarboxylase [Verrucomicrobiales bacterium]|nr:biosynthetic arginine decarboxylase [Verrucomicrobiae bacterium]MCP5554813.1 biosynthetic arginine decarboxylase [Akkermansiaceae bacterium]HRX53060.1 biosynthetic arginine decarboxylase [Verrucomicrobiales bacterium]
MSKSEPKTPAPPAKWTVEDSITTYGIDNWGHGYFDISSAGEVVVKLKDGRKSKPVSLAQIIRGLRERGTQLPVLLRFGDLLRCRIEELNECFATSIREANYKGDYRGVYPIKVNQQQEVIEEITRYGKKYHYGLEAGSKPEIIAALAYMQDPKAFIVCNGYKDEEFIDLALYAQKMGLQVILVLEMPTELDLILERSRRMGVKPVLGVRIRLSTESAGHWSDSGGDGSVFGLNVSQVMRVVDQLRTAGMLDCLQMLHYHQGSQIPDIRAIRSAATEAARVYVGLVQEGAKMGILDLGGGLAINYGGISPDEPGSANYGMREYCADVVEGISEVTDEAGVPHPNIISESGRAIAAYHSVLVINVLDINRFTPTKTPQPLQNPPPLLQHLYELREAIANPEHKLTLERLQEFYNDVVYYLEKLRSEFRYGKVTLRQRAVGEDLYWEILSRLSQILKSSGHDTSKMERLTAVMRDFYYGNFSVFQSLPDSWAIDQLFPVMPLHRLKERPERSVVLSDITCDCDGRIDRFVHSDAAQTSLLLHDVDLEANEEYLLGIFLVGAYQETLGDLHNLLGDTHVVSVRIVDGKVTYVREIEGDSVGEVLSYVEYEPADLVRRFRHLAEKAVTAKRITAKERREIMEAYTEGLRGYTYFEF